jgi:hypothetical protein
MVLQPRREGVGNLWLRIRRGRRLRAYRECAEVKGNDKYRAMNSRDDDEPQPSMPSMHPATGYVYRNKHDGAHGNRDQCDLDGQRRRRFRGCDACAG